MLMGDVSFEGVERGTSKAPNVRLPPNQDLGEYASLVTHSALQWQTHTQGLAGCLLWFSSKTATANP